MAKAEKIDKKELVKMAKALNKLELTEEKVAVKGNTPEIAEDFIQAIEEIDDAGKIEKVKEKIIDFYEDLLDKVEDSKDLDDKEPADEFERDDLEEELEDMDVKQIKKFIKDNDLDIDTKVKKKNLDDVIEEILDAMEEKTSTSGSDKKGKGGTSKSKDDKLPKGLRKGTLPAEIYKAIGDGASWKDLAKVVGKIKKKKPEKVMGLVLRTVSRKVSSAVPVVVTFNGDDETAEFTIGD